MDKIECLVIGAGVVGIAIARALALSGRDVIIVEENAHFGEESSSRNNEVIHAGFLYPKDSLRERLCLAGRERLYDYCSERGIGHARLGKLMPATNNDELHLIEAFRDRALELEMPGVELLSAAATRRLEPELDCLAALHSPHSGIVDSHALMVSLLGDAESGGAILAVHSRARSAMRDGDGFNVQVVSDSNGEYTIRCETLVNAAGLGALALMKTIDAFPAALMPRIFLAHGNFFSYRGKAPFKRLVMPVGNTLSDGAAFTLDLAGQGRFGPDLRWIGHRCYGIDDSARPLFANAIRRYWLDIEEARLEPAYAGIRPRTYGPSEPPSDWGIQGPAKHGVPGLVNLFAIETPGLTACMAIGDHVADMLRS